MEFRQSDLPDVLPLAFLGDAIFSHAVRAALVGRGFSHAKDLNRLSLAYVTAEAQSEGFLLIEPSLTENERALAKRAENSKHLNRPRHASPADYRRATALEALFGMLEVTGQNDRLKELTDRVLAGLAHREETLP
ncbi:MAG: ribonuclease III [Clostridia bacterium]|nr:ribonuclease III [Clostridia bacterium]MBR5044950.1 ribonuclease III [Clostridia bacterium]